MPVLIEPAKMKKKWWLLPGFSIAAVIILAGLLIGAFVWLGWQIRDASYSEADKKWSDLVSLTTPFVAAFTVIGGAISWLVIVNEKRKLKLVDIADTSLVAYYDSYTYLYDVSISLADNTVIKDVIHVIELFSDKGKVIARQIISAHELKASSHHQIKINDIARRFHLGFNDISAVNSYLIYRSNGFYWKFASANSNRFRLVEPKNKSLQSNGSFGYFKNNPSEIEENTERGIF